MAQMKDSGVMDLNNLRVFERVASLKSFSAAARALGLPKSSVSRSVARLEDELGTRLLQRTTREVALTEAGSAFSQRCKEILAQVDATIDYVSGLGVAPRGLLKLSAGIGFGVNVLSAIVPRFMAMYPHVDVSIELTSKNLDLITEGIDIAIRMGPMPDSVMMTTRLASLRRYMCASPQYLASRGSPATLDELAEHDTVEMLGMDGKPRVWSLTDAMGESVNVSVRPRLFVNDPLTIYKMVSNGAGIGCLTAYLCLPDIESGRLVQLFPEFALPKIDVNIVFPSSKALSPSVRAFVNFMKESALPGAWWVNDSDDRVVRRQSRASASTRVKKPG
jgi:LysR family transcriptional regulator, regulator for bpeEF and oprC